VVTEVIYHVDPLKNMLATGIDILKFRKSFFCLFVGAFYVLLMKMKMSSFL
jgi:hypothetical protein